MAHKMIIAVQVEVDLSDYKVGVNNPPWLNLENFDPRPMAEWLKANIYAGDKVSIIFPDTYIDVTFGTINKNQSERIEKVNHFCQTFMERSSLPSKNGVVRVRESLKQPPDPRYPLKAPPLCIFFMVKGSSAMTAGAWTATFNQMCGFMPYTQTKELHWPFHLSSVSESFKDVVEKCFGFKFKDQPFETSCVLESE